MIAMCSGVVPWILLVMGQVDTPVWPTAGDQPQSATLAFTILGPGEGTVPARLTFLNRDGTTPRLFTNQQAAPADLAVRENIVYSKTGQGRMTVPAGTYKIIASRGLEWNIGQRVVTLQAGTEVEFKTRLTRALDTTGWISGDFHLHTLTHSGHGDSNVEERVITFLGEGLEFAVATDHNHNTDYRPTMKKLGITGVTAVTGNEVSVPIGHFNAFPLDPARPVPSPDSRDAHALFKVIRAEPNAFGTVPIIQVNHPRWSGIDYFGLAGVDPVTAAATEAWYSLDFDSIEVFNENTGWGYYDADGPVEVALGRSRHWALRDWYNLLNRGHRKAAVGNSDSHEVARVLAGYPRNFVMSSTDDPDSIDVAEVAEAIRQRRLFTTLGPFVEYWVNGRPMGADVTVIGGQVELRVKLQAASWVDCDRVHVVINGDIAHVIDVPGARRNVRLDTTITVPVHHDAWLTVLVEGDDSLAPIVHDGDRPVLPLAVTNPVWLDVDGDGTWTSPWAQARAAVASAAAEDLTAPAVLSHHRPSERGLLVSAAVELGGEMGREAVARGLLDPHRIPRLHAARGAERMADYKLVRFLDQAYGANRDDVFMQLAMLRAIHVTSPSQASAMAFDFIGKLDEGQLLRYRDDIDGVLERMPVRDWMVVGLFDNPKGMPLAHQFGPEKDPGSQLSFDGRGGRKSWERRTTQYEGYLDLLVPNVDSTHAAAYAQTYIYSPTDREVRFAIGTDDGCRLWHNGNLVYEDPAPRSAHPLQHVGTLELNNGTNRVMIKVQNGTGNFGMYFQLFDEELIIVAKPASQ